MKAFKKLLMFALALVLVLSAIVITSIAADDVRDFIGKDEQQKIDEQSKNPPQAGNERPQPRPAYSTLRYDGTADHGDHIAGERLETRFDLAPALHGGARGLRLQTVQTAQTTEEEEQYQEIEPITEEIEPISGHIPPPNTGRDTFFIWGAFGSVALLGGLTLSLRKRSRRS